VLDAFKEIRCSGMTHSDMERIEILLTSERRNDRRTVSDRRFGGGA
jgi:hypothetical protein